MGRIPTGNRKYQIKHMRDVHHEVKRRLLIGQKNVDIAEAVGITKEMVSTIRNSSIVQGELSKLHALRDKDVVDVAKEAKRLEPKALALLEEVLDDEDHPIGLRAKVALEMLKPGGVSRPAAPQEHLHGHLHISSDDLNEIKERAKLARANVIDAEVVA